MDSLTLTRPDDWHLHLRDGDMLAAFRSHAAPWLTRLSRLESASLYASRD